MKFSASPSLPSKESIYSFDIPFHIPRKKEKKNPSTKNDIGSKNSNILKTCQHCSQTFPGSHCVPGSAASSAVVTLWHQISSFVPPLAQLGREMSLPPFSIHSGDFFLLFLLSCCCWRELSVPGRTDRKNGTQMTKPDRQFLFSPHLTGTCELDYFKESSNLV